MRYHYEKPKNYFKLYGRTYICDHPVYNKCTLFEIDEKGIAVIQQRYIPETKMTYWGEIDDWICNDIYLNRHFFTYFEKMAGLPENDIYPTVTIRQIMWKLKMKPLPREPWETTFDHAPI